MEVNPLTQKFVDALNQKFKGKETIYGDAIQFDVIPNEKYDKITLPRWDGSSHGSAHAFVERETGKLFKAASWKYPVQEFKYVLTEANFMQVVEVADPYGIYLDQGNRYKDYSDPTYGVSDKNEILNKNYKHLPQ